MVLEEHNNFIKNAVNILRKDERILGVAAAGSYITKDMDEFSDVDLVIAIKKESYIEVLSERIQIAEKLGHLLSAFTGEHVGSPRLLICLYSDPLLHVDLKFVSYDDMAHRVENFEIIWERNNLITEKFKEEEANFPNPDLQWIEDRFWVWIHYAAGKIGRGEIFETIEFISFVRQIVIGPLILIKVGQQPRGVRKIEIDAPEYFEILKKSVVQYDRKSCYDSIKIIIDLYRELRDFHKSEKLIIKSEAELIAVEYLDNIAKRLGY